MVSSIQSNSTRSLFFIKQDRWENERTFQYRRFLPSHFLHDGCSIAASEYVSLLVGWFPNNPWFSSWLKTCSFRFVCCATASGYSWLVMQFNTMQNICIRKKKGSSVDLWRWKRSQSAQRISPPLMSDGVMGQRKHQKKRACCKKSLFFIFVKKVYFLSC